MLKAQKEKKGFGTISERRRNGRKSLLNWLMAVAATKSAPNGIASPSLPEKEKRIWTPLLRQLNPVAANPLAQNEKSRAVVRISQVLFCQCRRPKYVLRSSNQLVRRQRSVFDKDKYACPRLPAQSQ